MDYRSPEKFDAATITCKANIYFEGKVVSHVVTCADGTSKTLGLIYPGSYKFDTAAPERMEIIAGECRVQIAGTGDWIGFPAGTWFDVPGKSFFQIEVTEGIAEYICSFG
jgi:uncharacterized protein YaiE (UPF0345 family)